MDSDADNLIYNFRLILMKGWDSDEYDNRHCSSAFRIRR